MIAFLKRRMRLARDQISAAGLNGKAREKRYLLFHTEKGQLIRKHQNRPIYPAITLKKN